MNRFLLRVVPVIRLQLVVAEETFDADRGPGGDPQPTTPFASISVVSSASVLWPGCSRLRR
jgi:hypothetical protein